MSACSSSTAAGAVSSLLLFLRAFPVFCWVVLVVCVAHSIDFSRDRCVCSSDLDCNWTGHVGGNGVARITWQPRSGTTLNNGNSAANRVTGLSFDFCNAPPVIRISIQWISGINTTQYTRHCQWSAVAAHRSFNFAHNPHKLQLFSAQTQMTSSPAPQSRAATVTQCHQQIRRGTFAWRRALAACNS